ncbi:MAG: ANTAR domain-containing protein [Clostridiales Family XIII bacterium]|jgi:response regulator NasT|nr:ANTAR domain-containing protein [Clostridiales Family XIII bacterium]
MNNILVVSGSLSGLVYFEDFLTACQYGAVTKAESAEIASAELSRDDYDLCIINAPLPDDSGAGLALDALKHGCCQCLVVAAEGHAKEIGNAVEPSGVFVLVKPLKRDILWATLKNIAVIHNRLQVMQTQNDDLKQKLEDMRIINHAKSLLISNLKMSENQAHKFLEKQAMERRMTKVEIARRIINTYDINRFDE